MLALLQRVNSAQVDIQENIIARIDKGILALIGFHPEDTELKTCKMVDKILQYRLFADDNDKMNCSLKDIAGGLLLVPQFTLAANTHKGLRPSFSSAAAPERGLDLFEKTVEYARKQYNIVQIGKFGADMQVSLCNDGPVTFILEN